MAAARSAGMRSPVRAYSLASWRLVSSGQVTGPAVGRDQADQHVGVGEVGALGHVDDVGQSHQAAAQADGGAVDRGHDRHPAGDHAADDLAAVGQAEGPQRRVPDELVDVLEVAAGRERPAVAGEHRHPGLGVGVELGEELGQALVQLVVGGVQVVGPVQADDADGAVDLHLDGVGDSVVGHEVGSSRIRQAMRLRWIWDVPPMTLWARL